MEKYKELTKKINGEFIYDIMHDIPHDYEDESSIWVYLTKHAGTCAQKFKNHEDKDYVLYMGTNGIIQEMLNSIDHMNFKTSFLPQIIEFCIQYKRKNT